MKKTLFLLLVLTASLKLWATDELCSHEFSYLAKGEQLPFFYEGSSIFGGSIEEIIIYSTGDVKLTGEPDNVWTVIPTNVFRYAKNLQELRYPCTIEIVEDYAFEDCVLLRSIEARSLSSQWKTIGRRAFKGCKRLTFKELPQTLETIGEEAFRSCDALTKIPIPASVTSIGRSISYGCAKLTDFVVDEGNTHYKSIDGLLMNYAGNTLLEYPSGRSLQDFSLPSCVTTIGERAFSGCLNFTSITIPATVTTLDEKAFYACTDLSSVTFDEHSQLKTIKSKAFGACSKLTTIEIPTSVTTIENGAFNGCNNLSEVYVYWTDPNQFPDLPLDLFNGIADDAILYVPTNMVRLYEDDPRWEAFDAIRDFHVGDEFDYQGLRFEVGASRTYNLATLISVPSANQGSVSIPKKVMLNTSVFLVDSISENAFDSCGALTDLHVFWKVPIELPRISDNTLAKFTTLHVPSGYENIYANNAPWNKLPIEKDSWIFYNAPEQINIPSTPFEYEIAHHEYIETNGYLYFNGQITKIPDNAFKDYTTLRSISLPNTITEIGAHAFDGCVNIESWFVTEKHNDGISSWWAYLTIPVSVKKIGDYAFANCRKVDQLHVDWTTLEQVPQGENMGEHVFDNIGADLSPINYVLDIAEMEEAESTHKGTYLSSPTNTKLIYKSLDQWKDFYSKDTRTLLPGTKFAEDLMIYEVIEKTSDNSYSIKLKSHQAADVSNTVLYDSIYFIPRKSATQDRYYFILKEIESEAFTNMINLTSLTIPRSVQYIGDRAFQGNTNLKNIYVSWTTPNTIPSGEYMGADVFEGIAANATLHVPYRTKPYYQEKEGWNGLNIVSQGAGISVVFVEDSIQYKVTKTGNANEVQFLKAQDTSLTSMNIPVSVVHENVPFTITSIADNAFGGCSKLTTLTLETGNPLPLGKNALTGCTALKHIYVPKGTAAIYNATDDWGRYASIISEIDKLSVGGQFTVNQIKYEVTVLSPAGNQVKVILNEDGYPDLGVISIPEVTEYNGISFLVTEIGAGAFTNYHLPFFLPTSIAKIGKEAFYIPRHHCYISVPWTDKSQIPSGNQMGVNALTPNVTTLYVPSNTVSLYRELDQWKSCEIIAPEPEIGKIFTINDIDYEVISNGGSYKVKVLSYNDYTNAAIEIPESIVVDERVYVVSAIDQNAFSGCDALTTVVMRSTTPLAIDQNAFSQSVSHIYVPYKTGDTYKQAEGWCTYSNIISDELFYIDAQGVQQVCPEAAIVVKSNFNKVTWTEGWYVVMGANVQLYLGVKCEGEVHLILTDGSKLICSGQNMPGIQVTGEGTSLTIYGQSEQTGELIAAGSDFHAGIGGNASHDGSHITINGGKISATGGAYGAGIGGGAGGKGSYITINGGEVTAIGDRNGDGMTGSGIGSGDGADCDHITINGGVVIAKGSNCNAGIGGGEKASCTDITINGGYIIASTDGNYASGIGAGKNGTASNIKVAKELIIKGDVYNPPTTEIAKDRASSDDITESLAKKHYTTIVGAHTVTFGENISVSPKINSGDIIRSGTQLTFTAADRSEEHLNLKGFYSDEAFQNRITTGVSGLTYTTTVTDKSISVYAKYDIKRSNVTYGDYITVTPTVASGSKAIYGTQLTFTATDRRKQFYQFNGFFSDPDYQQPIIEGVSGMTYAVTATGEPISVFAKYIDRVEVEYVDSAGMELTCPSATIVTSSSVPVIWEEGWYIVRDADVKLEQGAFCRGDVHLILADGAKLTATGRKGSYADKIPYSAGIEVSGGQSSLTIYGQVEQTGKLEAEGTLFGAGIGGGERQANDPITINGGDIKATGNTSAAGIGGGSAAEGKNITINGGKVRALGGWRNVMGEVESGAGIGGGTEADGHDITINGGEVTASGAYTNNAPAAIGGGYRGNGYNITITGGTVVANSQKAGAGIGGGAKGYGHDISILGGTVIANGGEDASAIGWGKGGESQWNNKNLFVADGFFIRADNTTPPTTFIDYTSGEDLMPKVGGKQYVVIGLDTLPVLREGAIAAVQDSAKVVENAIATLGLKDESFARSKQVLADIVDTATAHIMAAWKQEPILSAQQTAYEALDARWQYDLAFAPIEKARTEAGRALEDSVAKAKAWIENASIEERYKDGPLSNIDYIFSQGSAYIRWGDTFDQIEDKKQWAFAKLTVSVQEFLAVVAQFEQDKLAAIATIDSTAKQARLTIEAIPSDITGQYYKNWAYDELTNTVNEYTALINESDDPAYVTSRKNLAISAINTTLTSAKSSLDKYITLKIEKEAVMLTIQDSADRAKLIVPTVTDDESIKAASITAIDAIVSSSASSLAAAKLSNTLNTIQQNAFNAFANQIQTLYQDAAFAVKKAEAISYVNKVSETAIAAINNAGEGDYLQSLKDEYISQVTKKARTSVTYINSATVQHDIDYWTEQIDTEISRILPAALDAIHAAVVLHDAQALALSQMEDSLASAKAIVEACVIEQVVKDRAVRSMESSFVLCKKAILNNPIDTAAVMREKGTCLNKIFYQVTSVLRSAAELADAQREDLTAIRDSATSAKALINATIVADTVKTSALTTIDTTVTKAVNTIENALAINQFSTVKDPVLSTIGEQVKLVKAHASTLSYEKRLAVDYIEGRERTVISAVNAASRADYVQPLQQAAIDEMTATATKAKDDINASFIREDILVIRNTTSTSLEAIKTQALATIRAAVALHENQAQALKDITASVANAKAQISLAKVEEVLKTNATTAIDNAAATATDAIGVATTIEAVGEARQTALTAIAQQVQLVQNTDAQLEQARNEAQDAVYRAADAAIAAINNAETGEFVQSIKDQAITSINEVKVSVMDDIQAALTLAAVTTAKETAVTRIGIFQSQALKDIAALVSLTQAQAQAVSAVQDSALIVKEQIEALDLSDSVRTAYLSSIDSTVAVNTDAIDKTSTLEEVETAQQSAFAALATQWQTINETYQNQLEQAKSEGIVAINGAKTSAIEAITQASDADYVQTIQQTAIAAITTTADEAVNDISIVDNISAIEPAVQETLDSIEITKTQALADISALVNLTEAQTTALAAIQDAITNAKTLVNAAIVEQTIKTSALTAIDEAQSDAILAIPMATSVAEVQTLKQATLTEIGTLLQSVLDTDAQAKNDAIAAITKVKDDAYYELLYSSNSPDVATIKQTAMAAVVSTAADSIASIKAVTAVEAILPIQEGAIASINTIKEEALAQILDAPTLFDAQQEAFTAIQDSATNAKAVIDNLVVNTDVKTPAKMAISGAYSEAYNAIASAGTVAAVHAAKQTAFAAYGAQVQIVKDAVTELAQAKSEAIAAINAAAEQARVEMNAASSEDYVQSIKDAALDDIAYSVSYSTKGINNTLYVSIIPSLQTNGLNGIKTIKKQAIADIHAAIALHDAKDAAAIVLTDSAALAKELISPEVIDDATKTQAAAAIDAALATALTDIPTAEALQAIETIKQTALAAFAAQVQTVKDAATELARAKTMYIATIQTEAVEAIAEIRNASNEECARSIQDNAETTINNLVRMAEMDINAAMTVNDVVGIWFDVIHPTISAIKTQTLTNIATTVLNYTRETSMKAVQDSANSATTIIENAIAIQSVKDEALAAIQTIVETAINAIQMADVKELMRTAVTTAFDAIDKQVGIVRREAGILAVAKSSALKDINDAIATAKTFITYSGGSIDYIQPIKDAALASLEQVTAKVPEDINSAMDTATITTIKDKAITEIDAIRDKAIEDIATLVELTQERVTLLNRVKGKAGTSKNIINQTEVSSSIKTMALTAIDNALATALTDMEAAELLSELTNAYNTAVAVFETQVQAVTDAAAKEAQEKAALADAKTQALAAIQSAVTSAKQAINQAAIGYEYEAKTITESAFVLIANTDSTASAGIQAALTIAAIAPIKDNALTSIESTKTQAIEEINALIASILAKQAALQEAKDAAKILVQDSAANAFEAVKYLFVTPNVIYKAQEDLDYAESYALDRIDGCQVIDEIDGEVEFAFVRFAEIVAEAKAMEGGEETKIVPLYGTETTVTPTEEDVTITWPVYEEAESYTIIITEEGDTIYEIVFDTDGVRVGAPRRAPSMDGVNLAPAADLTMQGYQYTVSCLTTQTYYGYKVISKTVDNTVIYKNSGSFITTNEPPIPTGINTLPYEGQEGKGSFKVMENHRLFIIRDGKRYTMMGVEE